jgi:imidazolonepropionase-like amidohydrolase
MHQNRAVALLCLAFAFPSFAGKLTVIRAGTLIDPESGTAARDQLILIEDKTIKAVGHDLVVPPDASVIDLSKAVVLPGLFDAHTHLCERRSQMGPR